tara:strand:+ start:463 stop:744 length:282 start_codon:yes stop_codon:yes gene_type:complete
MNHEIANSIAGVEAIEIKGGFRIEAVFNSGEREIIKKKSTRPGTMVQLYSMRVNGNCYSGLGAYFTFAKNISKFYKIRHLKGFPVTLVESNKV